MIIETKFKYGKEPVLVTGGTFVNTPYVEKQLAITARITFQGGASAYVPFSDLTISPESKNFKFKSSLKRA